MILGQICAKSMEKVRVKVYAAHAAFPQRQEACGRL